MSAEMRTHIDEHIARNLAAGMSADDARAAAHRQFGGVAQIQERCRDARGGMWLQHWGRELRHALRSLWRAPGFSLAVFFTLTLCLGPNTAVLSALYALVLKPLPFPHPEQLVVISNVGAKMGGMPTFAGMPQYLDFSAQADRFEAFALYDMSNTTIGEDTVPARASGHRVTTGFFDLLGVQPQLGRFFLPAEEAVGSDRVLVLTDTFWRSKYNADLGVIGRNIRMGGETFTIVGVAPRSLGSVFTRTDFFKPFGHAPAELVAERRYTGARTALLGRLKPGVTHAAGLTQLAHLEERFRTEQANPGMQAAIERIGLRPQLAPLGDDLLLQIKQPLWLLQAAALFVLLIGAVNVANLLLARANARRPELAIRFALGGGRTALLRTMLCEILVLAGAAAVTGIAIASGVLLLINRTLELLGRFVPPVEFQPAIAVVIVLGALLIALLVGLVSFAMLWRSGLRVGDARTSSSRGGIRILSSVLVVKQVAIALMLLVGAGLLMRSFAKVLAVDPGFDAEHVVQGRIALSHAYDAPEANTAICRRIIEAMRAISGVDGVAASNYFGVGPASSFRSQAFTIRNAPETAGENRPLAYIHPVSPGFFETLNGRILEGREFREGDVFRPPDAVIVVDQSFAERYFKGRSAIGQEMALGAGPFPDDFKWARIIGVVARANITGLESRDGLPFLYLPMNQQPGGGFNVMVRSSRPPAEMLNAMRTALQAVDPTLPLYNTGTLRETLDFILTPRRFTMLLVAIFAGLALILAAVGLYGVLAYDVSQRTREIGIRGAIGATRQQIVAMILRQGLWKAGVGLGIGLGGAFCLTRFMRGLLFEVTPADPTSFLLVSALLLAVALLACWLPARRAAKVNPIVALRAE
jgi:putative ABC transport system permease protein